MGNLLLHYDIYEVYIAISRNNRFRLVVLLLASGSATDRFPASANIKPHPGPRGKAREGGKKPKALQEINVKRAIQAGQYRKGIQALTSEGLAPAT